MYIRGYVVGGGIIFAFGIALGKDVGRLVLFWVINFQVWYWFGPETEKIGYTFECKAGLSLNQAMHIEFI